MCVSDMSSSSTTSSPSPVPKQRPPKKQKPKPVQVEEQVEDPENHHVANAQPIPKPRQQHKPATGGHQQQQQQSGVMLQCGLCNVPYDTTDHEPKLLSCHHSYCLACLRELAVGRTAFRCPDSNCRRKTGVPKDGGICALPTNFYVAQMRDFVVYAPPATTLATNDDGDNESNPSKHKSDAIKLGNTCEKHLNQPLLFFCETCMVAICMNCTVLDHDKNGGHRISDIASALATHHDILRNKVQQMDRATDVFNTGLK